MLSVTTGPLHEDAYSSVAKRCQGDVKLDTFPLLSLTKTLQKKGVFYARKRKNEIAHWLN